MVKQFRHLARTAAALLFLVVSAGAGAVSPAAADGTVPLVACTGSALQNYSPGLTLTTRSTQVTSIQNYSTCVDAEAGSLGDPVASAAGSVIFTTDISCLVAPPVLNLQLTINWNGGRTSTADVLAVVSRTTGTTIATDTGTVTSGLFVGKTLNVTVVYPTLDIGGCLLGSGVTSISGIATLAVLPV